MSRNSLSNFIVYLRLNHLGNGELAQSMSHGDRTLGLRWALCIVLSILFLIASTDNFLGLRLSPLSNCSRIRGDVLIVRFSPFGSIFPILIYRDSCILGLQKYSIYVVQTCHKPRFDTVFLSAIIVKDFTIGPYRLWNQMA